MSAPEKLHPLVVKKTVQVLLDDIARMQATIEELREPARYLANGELTRLLSWEAVAAPLADASAVLYRIRTNADSAARQPKWARAAESDSGEATA